MQRHRGHANDKPNRSAFRLAGLSPSSTTLITTWLLRNSSALHERECARAGATTVVVLARRSGCTAAHVVRAQESYKPKNKQTGMWCDMLIVLQCVQWSEAILGVAQVMSGLRPMGIKLCLISMSAMSRSNRSLFVRAGWVLQVAWVHAMQLSPCSCTICW